MSAAAAVAPVRRLPGITVTVPPDETAGLLPRMDVAGFVGFAATGPVDVPVAITDPARFAEVFGPPAELFRDAVTGRLVRAYLSDAVAAFFAMGGRRCWVVRVTARQPVPPFASRAERVRFNLRFRTPDPLGNLTGAPLLARAVGGWAEQVTAGIVTLRTPLEVADVRIGPPSATGAAVRLRLEAGALAPFDLVELRQGRGRFLFAVTAVQDGTVTGAAGVWTDGTGPAPGAFAAHLVTIDLRATADSGRPVTLTGLGCVPGHARYLGDLLTDEELARLLIRDDPRPARLTALQDEARHAGFPLAGPRPVAGMPALFYPADAAPGILTAASTDSDLPSSATSLDREGLAEFSTALFTDPRLDGVGVRTVQATVELLRDVQGRQLVGLHALLGIDEVSLLCLPDVVHRPWPVPDLPAPQSYYGPSQSPFPPWPAPPPHETYRRPRECGHDDPESWHDVTSPALAPPELSGAVSADGPLKLTWSAVAGASFVVEESTAPWTWAGAGEVYRGRDNSLDLYGRTPGRYLYRLRAETDQAASDWGPTLVIDLPDLASVSTAPADLDALAGTQVAAMTACAGRGDLLAVLAGPAGQDAPDVAAQAGALRGRAGDDRLLSFGALYHPWTVTAAGAQVPPDGAATGLLAAVAAGPGCWREPANVPLAGVVALVPPPDQADAYVAETAGTNLVQPQPHGLVTLAAVTLSAEADLSRIAVRRLLSLLRRLALRDGPAFVFEPQGEVLRRHVRRHFETVLGQLLTMGALAGPGPAQSFQVVVDGSVPDRLAVDLKIAPAAALRFLTVRLVGAGNGVTAIEGA
jgi:hypothetical protein